MDDQHSVPKRRIPGGTWTPLPNGKRRLIGFIGVAAVASTAYRLIYLSDVWRSGALFILMPAGIAIAMILLRKDTLNADAVATAVFNVVLFALIGMVVLPEGFICWVFALPIMIIVGALVGFIVNASRRNTMNAVVMLPLLLLAGTEGVLIGDAIDPANTASASVVIEADDDALRARLAASPDFDGPLPLVLRAGFPVPVAAEGDGLEVGDTRVITFTGPNPTGSTAAPTMTLEVAELTDRSVRFELVEDTTMIGQWVTLRDAVIIWEPIDNDHLRVTWTSNHTRRMNPGWYFDPLQNLGMNAAVDYLLEEIVLQEIVLADAS